MEEEIAALKKNVVMPLTLPFSKGSTLLRAPRGVLLHGPPGCGKTLLVKALAKEAGCCFISLEPTTVMSKWYGETQHMLSAVFSLATKRAPAIIFVDEIDQFLLTRSARDSGQDTLVKTQFLQLWDGFSSAEAGNVVIVSGC